MKKIIFLAGLFMAVQYAVQAQTFDEWFRQKSTQKKYLLHQIAALQVYINYAQTGYQIAGKGVNTIHSIKNGDFNLHRDFFQSLKTVSPFISKYKKVAAIVAYQVVIIKQVKATLAGIEKTGQFTPSEVVYSKNVLNYLLAECIKTADNLIAVITSGNLEMKDNERLRRVNELYTDMQGKYEFCSTFRKEVQMLSMQRLGEQMEVNNSKIINSIK